MSTIKVDNIDSKDSTGNITISRPIVATLTAGSINNLNNLLTPANASVTAAKMATTDTLPAWNGSALTNVVPADNSVTGAKINLSLVAGDTMYASATDTLAKLAKGTDGEVMTLASGVPSWAAAAGGGGKIVKVVNVQNATVGTGTTTCPSDDTIPQISETNVFLTLNITPTSAANYLLIFANVNVVFNFADGYGNVALFNDDTHATNALCVTYVSHHANFQEQLFLQHYMLADQNTEMTFKVGVANLNAGTIYHNSHTTGARVYGGKMFS